MLIKNKNVKGNIIYEGKNIFGGYAKSCLDLSSFDNKTELKTGDVGYQDKNGKFFICGRKSRFIKIYGYRLNLDYFSEPIAQILLKHFRSRLLQVKYQLVD